jgi:hypothetical protein
MKIADAQLAVELSEAQDGLAALREALNKEGANLQMYVGDGDGTMFADTAIPMGAALTAIEVAEKFIGSELSRLGIKG